MRLGNWLTAEQSRTLLEGPDHQRLKGRRDKAILALLLGCGLRRVEVAALRLVDDSVAGGERVAASRFDIHS